MRLLNAQFLYRYRFSPFRPSITVSLERTSPVLWLPASSTLYLRSTPDLFPPATLSKQLHVAAGKQQRQRLSTPGQRRELKQRVDDALPDAVRSASGPRWLGRQAERNKPSRNPDMAPPKHTGDPVDPWSERASTSLSPVQPQHMVTVSTPSDLFLWCGRRQGAREQGQCIFCRRGPRG